MSDDDDYVVSDDDDYVEEEVPAPAPPKPAHIRRRRSVVESRPPECQWMAMKNDLFSVKELYDAGCSISELLSIGFVLPDFKDAEFSARAMRLSGFGIASLAAVYDARSLFQAGFDINLVMSHLPAQSPISHLCVRCLYRQCTRFFFVYPRVSFHF